MSKVLLPCPFCGKSENVYLETDFAPARTKCNWSARVICLDCFGTAQTHEFEWTEENAKRQAIAAWNRRADHLPDATKKVSNADRIRSMSDEELARETLFFVPSDFNRHYTGIEGGYYATADEAIQANFDWLQRPAKEEIE